VSFRISSIVLWPQQQASPHRLDFNPIGTNFVVGPARSGKSSLLFAIDYCLGSSRCQIPEDIQAALSWIGLILLLPNGTSALVARDLPPANGRGDSYYIANPYDTDSLPKPQKTCSVPRAKILLHELTGHSTDVLLIAGNLGSIGFRDYSLLCFQPQHILGNPYALFFKCDDAHRRDKLRLLLPSLLIPKLRESIAGTLLKREREAKQSRISHVANQILTSEQKHRSFLHPLLLEAISLDLYSPPNPPDASWTIEQYIDAIASSAECTAETLSHFSNEIPLIPPIESTSRESLDAGMDAVALPSNKGLSGRMGFGHRMLYALKLAQFLGKIEGYQATNNVIAELDGLRTEHDAIDEELRASTTLTLNEERRLLRDEGLNLSSLISKFAKRMSLDHEDWIPYFDLHDMRLVFEFREAQYSGLSGMGSSRNWVGYHVALMLSLHQRFSEVDTPNTPRFLILDQISQAYFPDQQESKGGKALDDSLNHLEQIYSVVSEASSLPGAPQIIAVDRFAPHRPAIGKSFTIVANWFDTQTGFIPYGWLGS
jgi:Protein of unknown function (DUF3732)